MVRDGELVERIRLVAMEEAWRVYHIDYLVSSSELQAIMYKQ
jgi:hypothetical protein